VAQVVNQIGRSPVLVGHSIGGMVVQKYLEQNEAPAAVLLAHVPPSGIAQITMRVVRQRALAVMKALVMLRMFPIIGTPQLALEAFFSADMPQEKVEDYFSHMQDESLRLFLYMLMPNRPRTERMHTPLLVLGATDDGFISLEAVAATAHAYGVQADIFPGMAHDMMLEDDWQRVADQILM